MPLSEHEQKLLEQMEQALYAEDPRFATHMKGSRAASASRRRIIIGVVTAVLGLGLVVAGTSTELIALGVVGFLVMVGGVAWAFAPGRTTQPDARLRSVPAPGKPVPSSGATAARRHRGKGKRGPAAGSFMQRLEERWEKRRRDQGGW